MVDRNEADDKIIAVLDNDKFWNKVEDIEDMSEALVDRFKHTLKL